MHLALPVARERVELVEEEEGGPPLAAERLGRLEDRRQLLLALAEPLEKSASSGAYTIGSPASAAAMRAAVVFPVPGGP